MISYSHVKIHISRSIPVFKVHECIHTCTYACTTLYYDNHKCSHTQRERDEGRDTHLC